MSHLRGHHERRAQMCCAITLLVRSGTSGAGHDHHKHPEKTWVMYQSWGVVDGWIGLGEHLGESEGDPFGYDPVFFPSELPEDKGATKIGKISMSELSAPEKNLISHRYRAIQPLIPIISMLAQRVE